MSSGVAVKAGVGLTDAFNRYSPGRLIRRQVADETAAVYTCTTGLGYKTVYTGQTLTRLTWIETDGTEHELKDVFPLVQGQPLPTPTPLPESYNCLHYSLTTQPGPSRGTIFVSDDATAMTFIADSAVYDYASPQHPGMSGSGVSGWLLFKDGTRYQTGPDGSVIAIVDRNGNTTNFSYGVSGFTATDSLNRTTTVTYGSITGPATDTIQYPGAGGLPHTITINYNYLANCLRPDFSSTQNLSTLFPTTSATGAWDPPMVCSVGLPDGSSYTFRYNPYGEIARVTLPWGGAYEYDYPSTTPDCTLAPPNPSACALYDNPNGLDVSGQVVYRRVTARRVYPNGSTLEGQTCYSPTYGTGTTVQVTYTNSSSCTSGILSTETHVFKGDPLDSGEYPAPPGQWYADWTLGRETQSTWSSAQGGALRSTSTLWGADANNFNPTVCQTVTTLDGVSTSGAFARYDQYFNVADHYEYDFGAAPSATSCSAAVPAGYTRHTHAIYIADGVYDVVAADGKAADSNHMRNLVQEKDVSDGSGNPAAKTTYGYDENLTTEHPSDQPQP